GTRLTNNGWTKHQIHPASLSLSTGASNRKEQLPYINQVRVLVDLLTRCGTTKPPRTSIGIQANLPSLRRCVLHVVREVGSQSKRRVAADQLFERSLTLR